MKSSPARTTTVLTLASLLSTASCFAPSNINIGAISSTPQSTNLHMIPDLSDPIQMLSSMSSASNFISTVSADIDSIPTNEFATVFAGGITVMIGGVLSTVVVGFLLESNNSYASVVADSYAQGGDEAFWESLSPEDQIKGKEMLEKLRKSKEGKNGAVAGSDGKDSVVEESKEVVGNADGASKKGGKKEEVSMFSDYDD